MSVVFQGWWCVCTLSSTPLSPAVMIQAGAGGRLPVPFPMMYLLLMDPHRLRDRHRCSSGTQRAVKPSQAVLLMAGKTTSLAADVCQQPTRLSYSPGTREATNWCRKAKCTISCLEVFHFSPPKM